MLFRKTYYSLCVIIMGSFFLLVACPNQDTPNTNTVKPAKITFFNESTYYVDLYKNLNPLHYDPTALVYTFSPAETKVLDLYSSFDQLLGDAFYPQYKVRLADLLHTGTVDIFVPAQRILTNLTFVIKSGDKITKTIPNPKASELTFYHAYIIVKNNSRVPIQIIRGSNILSKMDNGAVLLSPDDTGYYEIEFTPFDTVINMTQLNAFSSDNMPFPSFTVEKGKKYSFTVGDTVTGPVIANILN